jgi:spermidine synthase
MRTIAGMVCRRPAEDIRLFRVGVLLCFFGSGMTSLVLEVVWTRILGTVFGNTVLASSTVLTAFMLGLALGSFALGKWVERIARPLMLYGLLEAGIGLYALAFPWLTVAGSSFYIWFYRACAPGYWTLNLVRLGLSLIFLLPPTFLMGGTLPVLTRHLGTGREEPGREAGYLYSVNTWGGVAGSALAGFILLEWLGVNGSLYAAGITAMVVGLLGASLGRLARERTPAAAMAVAPARRTKARTITLSPSTRRVVVWAFAITGFCALACEVLWTRVLLFLLGTTAYAFAVMLTTFLAGTALGAFVSTRWLVPRIKRPVAWFGGLEVLVGLGTLASVYLLAGLGTIDLRWMQGLNPGGRYGFVLVLLADAAVVLLAPTFLMGMAFPVVTTGLLRGEPELGRRLGQAYGANTLGCLLGSLAAGFLLLPALGMRGGLLAVVALNLAAGLLLLWQAAQRAAVVRWGLVLPCAVLVTIAFLLTPADIFTDIINTYHSPSRLTFVREHSTGTVTVHDLPDGDRLIAVDGVDVAGLDFMLRTTQKLQGYIPLCLHPNPRRVAQIGFGSGETARVGMEFGVPEYTVVEICPAIFEAGEYFSEVNHGSYQDPRIRRIIMDGKNFALLSGEKFDVIMNDSVFPGSSGSSALYTLDHFVHCRERLAPGGLFSCWVPLDLRPSELRMILKSFQQVFPHTSFWVASNCLNKHGLILGSVEPLEIDFTRLEKVLSRPDVKRDLAAISILDVYDFLDCFICDENSIRQLVADAPINSDDHPFVTHLPEPATNQAQMRLRFDATTHILSALVAQLADLPKERRRQLDLALQIIPGHPHVQSCEAELEREIHDLRQVLQTYPASIALSRRLADKLYIGLRYEEAAGLYDRLLRIDPEATDFVHLAHIQFSPAAPARAEGTLLKCLERWPDTPEALVMLADICFGTGRTAEAGKHLEHALRLEPGNLRLQQFYREVTSQLRGSG